MELKLLIVDDSEMERDLLSIALKDTYNVYTANNGYEALERMVYGDEKYDLVILDIMMPVLSGFDVLTRMRENERTKNIPVVLCTSEGSNDNVSKGFELGMSDFIVKPFDLESVKLRIAKALQNAGDQSLGLAEALDGSSDEFADFYLQEQLDAILGIKSHEYSKYDRKLSSFIDIFEDKAHEIQEKGQRMSKYIEILGDKMLENDPNIFNEHDLAMIMSAAKYSQIGKLCVNTNIRKAGQSIIDFVFNDVHNEYRTLIVTIIKGFGISVTYNVALSANIVTFISKLDDYIQSGKHVDVDFVDSIGSEVANYYEPIIKAYNEVVNDIVWAGNNL